MKAWRTAGMLGAGAALLAVASCGGSELPGQKSATGPAVSIHSPENNDEVRSSSIWVDLGFRDFELSAEGMGGAHVDGQGHYHVYVDGNAVGEGVSPRVLVTDLEPGIHEVAIRLFQNDHQPVPGATPAIVTILIPDDAPAVNILSPGQGATVASSSVELSLQTKHHNSGRWHAYVDTLESEPTGIGFSPTDVVTRIPPGRHEIYVRLHHSDGTPYEPDVVDKLVVDIPESAPRVRITTPTAGETVSRNVTIHVEAENFEIDQASAGGLPQPGEGHYHIYVGGYESSHMWQEGYWPETTLDNIPTGTRDIYVRLMNNDHTSIEPKIVDRIRVEVE